MTVTEHDDLELMSMRRLSDSLEATRTMLRHVQEMADAAQAALIGLGTEFCGLEFQQRQERNVDLSKISPEELAALLRNRFKSLKLVTGTSMATQLAEANRALAELRAEVEAQRSRADRAEEKAARLEGQVHALERTLENERQARREAEQNRAPSSTKSTQTGETNEILALWLASWKSENRNLERDFNIIRITGKTGLSISTELEDAVAQQVKISQRTARRAIQDCVEYGLLERGMLASTEGRPPQCYTLTDKGKWLYQELTGEEAKVDDHSILIKSHKSEKHLALILKVADLFFKLGFEVDREPLRIQIDENRFYMPDLAVRKDGETFYLEVEHGDKDKSTLGEKWANALAAGGRICVVTDNLGNLRRIQGSIAEWSEFEGSSMTLYITYLEALKKMVAGDVPWYAVKEYGQS